MLTLSPILLATLAAVLLVAAAPVRPLAAQDTPAAGAVGGDLVVPPLPQDGGPKDLLEFVTKTLAQPVPPAPREATMKLFRDRAGLAYEASDKVLGMVKTDDESYEPAVRMKMQSLMMLAQLGDPLAPKRLGEFAATLIDSPSKPLAREARRMTIITDMQAMFTTRDVAGAGAIVERIEALVKEDPADPNSANLAMQTAGALEQFPGGEALSMQIYRRIGPLLAASDNERTKAISDMFAGILRRLDLPGHAMEITGTNMDGTPFDQKQLDGKVVLVDFWATWCGPCVAEMPNVLEQYAKYHDKGFEVVGVSLDNDRAALEAFIAENKLPWIILHEQQTAKGGHPLAAKYGITGIPTVILIGRDGKVVTMDARGEKLGEQLDLLFKDPR
jgi:thiol-disulfide isomerase/thioredoxin